MAEVSASLPYLYFPVGKKGVIYFLPPSESFFDPDDLVLFAQIHGHWSSHPRWLRNPKAIEQYISGTKDATIDNIQQFPLNPSPNNADAFSNCIFTTTKIPISPSALQQMGLIIEFELPCLLLPSYKGRSVQILYFVTIEIQNPTSMKKLHFPLNIASSGSIVSVYQVQIGGILAYSPSVLSPAVFQDTSRIELFDGFKEEMDQNESATVHDQTITGEHQPLQSQHTSITNPIIYKVRDIGLICNVIIEKLAFAIGFEEEIVLDFTKQEQTCYAVKCTLIQEELEILHLKGETHYHQVQVRFHFQSKFEIIIIVFNVYFIFSLFV
jgi:hypothetical protein